MSIAYDIVPMDEVERHTLHTQINRLMLEVSELESLLCAIFRALDEGDLEEGKRLVIDYLEEGL